MFYSCSFIHSCSIHVLFMSYSCLSYYHVKRRQYIVQPRHCLAIKCNVKGSKSHLPSVELLTVKFWKSYCSYRFHMARPRASNRSSTRKPEKLSSLTSEVILQNTLNVQYDYCSKHVEADVSCGKCWRHSCKIQRNLDSSQSCT